MALTKLEHLIDPEVMADMISAQVPHAIRFYPLATVDNTLVGRPGSTLTVPTWEYIGDAEDIPEGTAITPDQMSATDKTLTIKKAGKGIEITDEAVLSGLGDPIGEGVNQLSLSISHKIDSDLLEELKKATQTAEGQPDTVAGIQGALDIFSDEEDEPSVLVINPVDAGKLRADAQKNYLWGTVQGAEAVISGTFGEILGAQVARSNKLKQGEAFLVKAGAIRLLMKRDTQVEHDRDILKKTTVITADQHYGAYLYDPSKVVKFESSAPEV